MRTTLRSSPASVERVFASTGAAFASRAGVLHEKMSSLDYLDLCRLCLVKDRVSVPIFEGEGDVRQIFLKITACLPVKVDREDKLPKKICDDCVYKVELFYQFWNTSVNAEKQLLQWLGEVGLEEKPDYVTNVLNQNVMKPDPSGGNRLDGSMLQQVSGHQNNMGMGMMDNISLSMPMIMSTTNQQQITSVPMDTSGSSVQEMPGTSTQSTHEQITQSQTNTSNQHEEEEESSEEEENSEDECDGEEGLPVKEESEEDPNNSRVIEPTTFVNVSLACDEAGPSGLQQQKVTEMPEMAMQQSTDGDPKSGEKCIRKQRKRRNVKIEETLEEEEEEEDVKKKEGEVVKKKEEEEDDVKEDEEEEIHQESTFVIFQFVNTGELVPETNSSIKKRTTTDPSADICKENVEVDVLDKIRNVCPFCDKQFSNEQSVERHVMVVHQRQYKCDMCKRSYNTQTALDVHKVIHRPDYFFECMECHVKYKSEGGLKRHYIRAHDRNNPIFVCEQCGRSYKLKIDLTNHIKKAHPFELQICRYCGKEVRDVKGHEYIHQRKARKKLYNFPCHLCPQKFCHRSRLDRHLLQHENGFKCTDCGESFIGSRELKNHKRFKHSRPSSSTCIFCQKVFTCVSNFHQHVLTHAGIRPYKCDICEEDFTQRSSLLRHRRNHSGPLPPLALPSPQIAELARSYMQKFQNGQIDKTSH